MECFCILGGTSWYTSCGLSPLPNVWRSGCCFPDLSNVPPNQYTPASHSHWDFWSCSGLLFFFPLLLSHLTHKQHQSRRGCVFTARQFLQHQGWVQGNGWKICYTHTHTHLPFGWWKTSTVPKMFVYSCPGCFDIYAVNEGNHPTSQHSTQDWIRPRISLETSQVSSPAHEMLDHITGDVPTNRLMRPLCSFSALEHMWKGATKKTSGPSESH